MILKTKSAIVVTNQKGNRKISKMLESKPISAEKRKKDRITLQNKLKNSGIYDSDF